VDRYGDYLYRYAMLRLRDRAAAEDAVQETFLAALSSRGTFSGDPTEATWLVGVLKHKIADHYRHQARKAPLEGGDLSEHPDAGNFDGAGHWTAGPAVRRYRQRCGTRWIRPVSYPTAANCSTIRRYSSSGMAGVRAMIQT